MKTNDVQTEVTSNLISEEGIEISLIRRGSTRTASFGVSHDDATTILDPVRRFFSGTTFDERIINTANGSMVEGSFVIIGMPDDDMQAGDEFEAFGNRYRINKIHSDRRYQTKGWCDLA